MSVSGELLAKLSQWEDTDHQLAKLSSAQRNALQKLTEDLAYDASLGTENAQTIFPADDSRESSTVSDLPQSSSNRTTNEGQRAKSKAKKFETGQEFLNWLDKIETNIQSKKSAHFVDYAEQIRQLDGQLENIKDQVDSCRKLLAFLREQNLSASTRSNNLHNVCEGLLKEMKEIDESKKMIHEKRQFFVDADRTMAQVNLVSNAENLMKLLADIDRCNAFFRKNPHYKDSAAYEVKCQAASSKALFHLKDYFRSTIDGAVSSAGDATYVYNRLKGVAPKVGSLMSFLIECPAESTLLKEFETTYADCVGTFVEMRRRHVAGQFEGRVAESLRSNQADHCRLVRENCIGLMHILKDEESLLAEFFPEPVAQERDYMESLCVVFYDLLRPRIVKLHHLETLSELSSILKNEMLEQTFTVPEGLAKDCFAQSVTQMWQDIQERLVYRAYIFIDSDIRNFSPHDGDLSYPEKLEMMEAIHKELGNDLSKSSPSDIHGMWYPTVKRTLMCLSKLFRSVEKDIFHEVAQEALKACVESLLFASDAIKAKKSRRDGLLFSIKHLLILREQITPFNILHGVNETSLDFSSMMSLATVLFQSHNENTLDLIVRNSLPNVKEVRTDYRRELDRTLKATCEAFIADTVQGVTKHVKHLLLLDDKTPSNKLPSSSQVQESIAQAVKSLRSEIPLVQKKMRLYLANRETEFILFKPVKNEILDSFERLNKKLPILYEEKDLLIIACPTIEAIGVNLASIQITQE